MKVFLSHAESDREVGRKLAARLQEAGHRVWFAEDKLFPGDNWALQTGKALEESEAMVVLISPQAMKSSWVLREIEFALGMPQYRGRLIPVIIKPTAEMPWILKKFPMVRIGPRIDEASREINEYIRHGFELTPAVA